MVMSRAVTVINAAEYRNLSEIGVTCRAASQPEGVQYSTALTILQYGQHTAGRNRLSVYEHTNPFGVASAATEAQGGVFRLQMVR